MKQAVFKEWKEYAPGNPSDGFFGKLIAVAAVAVVGLLSAWYMEHNGHWVTGMNNQIVWGMPHVFAVFLIVAASGALNIASIGSVFGKTPYKPLARLSGLLAVSLLAGGLAVLVLDLGRPDRLIVAMTRYNFKSIFAWNIFLYSGFMVIAGVYLWTMMDRKMNSYSKQAGLVAFLWRLALTTGTGLIFGFLVARQAYDAAVFAPLFVAMSFSFGMAIFILILSAIYENEVFGDFLMFKMGRLLGVFIAAVLYFTIVQHITNLYAAEHSAVEMFILLDGGIFTALFWFVQVLLGGLVPLGLLFPMGGGVTRGRILLASMLVIVGGLAQVYVIIVGGQAFPLVLFPGMEVSSSFFDGVVTGYKPSLPETLLGIGGFAIAGVLLMAGIRAMRILPEDLSDKAIDPHYTD